MIYDNPGFSASGDALVRMDIFAVEITKNEFARRPDATLGKHDNSEA
jgi:hypothetical protein